MAAAASTFIKAVKGNSALHKEFLASDGLQYQTSSRVALAQISRDANRYFLIIARLIAFGAFPNFSFKLNKPMIISAKT
jgi:hypothetical protein